MRPARGPPGAARAEPAAAALDDAGGLLARERGPLRPRAPSTTCTSPRPSAATRTCWCTGCSRRTGRGGQAAPAARAGARDGAAARRMAAQSSERERAAMQVRARGGLLLRHAADEGPRRRGVRRPPSSSITDFGFFVELDVEHVEGLVQADEPRPRAPPGGGRAGVVERAEGAGGAGPDGAAGGRERATPADGLRRGGVRGRAAIAAAWRGGAGRGAVAGPGARGSACAAPGTSGGAAGRRDRASWRATGVRAAGARESPERPDEAGCGGSGDGLRPIPDSTPGEVRSNEERGRRSLSPPGRCSVGLRSRLLRALPRRILASIACGRSPSARAGRASPGTSRVAPRVAASAPGPERAAPTARAAAGAVDARGHRCGTGGR